MTNREWLMNEIQNASDEKIAEGIQIGIFEPSLCEENCAERCCLDYRLNWLKQEHKEKIKLSEAERVILENLDKKYEWIARDSDNEICVYEEKPRKTDADNWDTTISLEYESLSAFNHLFQFVKWEDKEPYNIKELLEVSED